MILTSNIHSHHNIQSQQSSSSLTFHTVPRGGGNDQGDVPLQGRRQGRVGVGAGHGERAASHQAACTSNTTPQYNIPGLGDPRGSGGLRGIA